MIYRLGKSTIYIVESHDFNEDPKVDGFFKGDYDFHYMLEDFGIAENPIIAIFDVVRLGDDYIPVAKDFREALDDPNCAICPTCGSFTMKYDYLIRQDFGVIVFEITRKEVDNV